MKGKVLRTIAAFLCIIIGVGIFAGCGTTGTTDPAAPAPGGTTDPAAPAPGGSTGSTAELRVITIATNRNPVNLDPHNQADMGSEAIIRHIYNSLIHRTPDGGLHPNLAKEWEYADDNMSITVYLRDDVTWHNGDPFTAEDVKFSYERQLRLPLERQYVALMDDCTVIDPHTVRINLHTPAPGVFMTNITGASSNIVPKDYTEKMEAEGKALGEHPIGTGPYKFVSFTPNDQVVLVRNEDYFGIPAANAGLTFKIIVDDAARTIALETGDADFVVEVPSADVDRIDNDPTLELYTFESAWMEYVCLNQTKAPFDNILVRQAIAHLVDREAIIAVAENGRAKPLYTPAGHGDMTYVDLPNLYPYDVEKAKELLAQAGYPNGFEAEAVTVLPHRERIAVVLQQSFEQAGINLIITPKEMADYLEYTARGDHEIMLGSRNTAPEPESGIGPLYRSTSSPDVGNRWFLRDTKIDEYFDAALLLVDLAERQPIYHQMHRYIMEQAYTLPLYTRDGMVAYRSGLVGAEIFPFGAHFYTQLHYE